MDDVVAVQIAHSTHHLPEVEGRKVLLEVVFLSDFLKETPISD